MIGETVGPYEVERRLGSGGMGDVYLATDTRLDRSVALKCLSHQRIGDENSRSRFTQEARTVSNLDHQNICTIYDIGELDDGRLYIAMAYYEGETLWQRMDRGPLELTEAIPIVSQMLDGLGRAHEAGVVHRDVKPANVIITERGEVKLLDFGLAKLRDAEPITADGLAIGTPAYMSPEQAMGRDVDHRTDLWATGVILYEMTTGELPFNSPREISLLFSIARDEPDPMTGLPTGELMAVGPIIRKALAKDPETRYFSTDAMADDLKQVQRRLVGTSSDAVAVADTLPTVAVLPFDDLSREGDQGYFCTGLSDEITTALSRVDGLRIASRTSAAHLAAQGLDVRTLGQRLGVDSVLEGSVRTAGERIRVVVELVDVGDGLQTWSGRFDREFVDVFAIQEEIAAAIAEKLTGTLDLDDRRAVERDRTPELAAYNAYLKARHFWNRRTTDGFERGISLFEEAIDRDTGFAEAHAGLADSYLMLAVYGTRPPREVMPAAREAARAALELDERLAAAHCALGSVHALYEWNWSEANAAFERAIDADPSYATARQWYAVHLLVPQRRFEEARQQLAEAQRLDPLSQPIAASLGSLDYYRRDHDRAIERQKEALEIDPNFALAHYFLGLAYLEKGLVDDALSALNRARVLARGSVEVEAALACTDALAGERQAAERRLADLRGKQRDRYVSSTLIAQIQLALDDRDGAMDSLRTAVDDRAADLVWLPVRPLFDPLREEEPFADLLRQMGLGGP